MLKKMRTALFAVAVLAMLSACGVNPVTGKKEIQFISAEQEIQIGRQHYAPSRQSQGGDLKLLPELTAYVSSIGQRLAAVSDRELPYEFVVLNSSVPNAWALPGGKIAVNRGLLTTLDNEAELAAVLGHEIVHAAARHGAKAQERGTFLQAGMIAAQIGVAVSDTDPNLGNLLLQGAGVGAQMVSLRYGREAELEADLFGMRYMQRAGYDPRAAITLQQKFLALSQNQGRNQSWFEGLFASHPPSGERVERNAQTATSLPGAGELGAERYAVQLAPLRAAKPAYDKADEAMAAAGKKEFARARQLANEAARLLPKEGRFQQLLGDIEMAEKKPQAALPFYDKAIELDSGYFGPYLGGGIAAFRVGNTSRAEQLLSRSAELLPTAPAMYYLGSIAKGRGDVDGAMKMFRSAAESNSEIGKQAALEFATLDLPRNPGNYLAAGLQFDARGVAIAVLENRSPVTITRVALTPVRVDAAGRIVEQGRGLQLERVIRPGERITVDPGIGTVSAEVAPQLRLRVDAAAPAATP